MRNKLIRGALAASVSLLALNASASSQYDIVPYVGADAQWRTMEFKKGYGKDQTKSNYPQGNIYAGVKLNENVGLEVGYEQTSAVKKNITLNTSDMAFGIPFPGLVGSTQYNTKTKIRAFHANVVGFLPISEEYCLQLVGSLGIARSKIDLTLDIPVFDSAPNTDHFEFSKSKWIPKVGVGLQHMLTCNLGIRGMVNWEGTSSLKNMTTTNIRSNLIAQPKDSVGLGLGIFYNFK